MDDASDRIGLGMTVTREYIFLDHACAIHSAARMSNVGRTMRCGAEREGDQAKGGEGGNHRRWNFKFRNAFPYACRNSAL